MHVKIKSLNKKADVSLLEMVFYIIALLGFIYILTSMTERIYGAYTDTHKLEQYILYHRSLYSPNGVIYQDPLTGRSYPGLIDKQKFTDDSLSNLYNEDAKKAFSLHLTYNTDHDAKEIFFNKPLDQIGIPIADIQGSRYSQYGKDDVDRIKYLLLKDQSILGPISVKTESVFVKNDQ